MFCVKVLGGQQHYVTESFSLEKQQLLRRVRRRSYMIWLFSSYITAMMPENGLKLIVQPRWRCQSFLKIVD